MSDDWPSSEQIRLIQQKILDDYYKQHGKPLVLKKVGPSIFDTLGLPDLAQMVDRKIAYINEQAYKRTKK